MTVSGIQDDRMIPTKQQPFIESSCIQAPSAPRPQRHYSFIKSRPLLKMKKGTRHQGPAPRVLYHNPASTHWRTLPYTLDRAGVSVNLPCVPINSTTLRQTFVKSLARSGQTPMFRYFKSNIKASPVI